MMDSDSRNAIEPELLSATSSEASHESTEAAEPLPAEELVQVAVVRDAAPDDEFSPLALPGGEAEDDLGGLNFLVGRPEEAPLETAVGLPGPSGGGGGSYQSDFGDLLGGLRASDGRAGPTGTATPGNDVPVFQTTAAEPAAGTETAPAAVPPSTSPGDANDTSGGGDSGSGDDDANSGGYTGSGGDGDDTSGNDEVAGGELSDLIDGSSGNDSLWGGSSRDTLLGGDGNDTLLAGDGNDLVEGGKGNDSIDGGLGNDLLDGGSGSDVLIGGAGDDTLLGGKHNDTLTGGAGDDVMTGGSGKDAFSFSLSTNEGDDLILDFKTGNGGDRLEIADVVDQNGDRRIDMGDLDAGGHSVIGTADSVVITFDSGTSITLDGINGAGVNSFDDLQNIKVDIDFV